MLRAEIKRLHSPDIIDLKKYVPADLNNFCFLVQVMVGLENIEGEESFDVEVCTPKWLEEYTNTIDVIMGNHYLIVKEYNYERLYNYIEKYVQNSSGLDWPAIVAKLSVLGKWEFKDYQEYKE